MQAISTVVLVLVTAVYVLLTRSIAQGARRQAVANEAQVTHSQNVLVESAKARLSTLTPICSVISDGSNLMRTDGTSIGSIPEGEFDNLVVTANVYFTARNDGTSPTLLTVLPQAIEDVELTMPPDWAETIKDQALLGGTYKELQYSITGPGRMFRRWGDESRPITLEFETSSPVSGVVDRHAWFGVFGKVRIHPGGTFDYSTEGFTGPSAATLARHWPEDLDAT
jgi:hypothetical protein